MPSFGKEDDPEAWERARAAQRQLAYLDHEPQDLTFSVAAGMWLEEVKAALDPVTWTRYEQSMRTHILPSFGALRMRKVRRRRIRLYVLDKLQAHDSTGRRLYTRATVRTRMFGVLRTFLGWCVDEEILPSNPAGQLGRKLFRGRNITKKMGSMSEDQMVRWYLSAERMLKPLHLLLVTIALDAALRIGEVLGLRWDDVDFAGGVLHVRRQLRTMEPAIGALKTDSSERSVEMSARLQAMLSAELRRRQEKALKMQRQTSAWIAFPHCTVGQPTLTSGFSLRGKIQRAMRRTTKDAGLPQFTCHSLRHTCLTLLANHGIDMKALQRLAGHSCVQQTEHYVKRARPKIPGAADHFAQLLEARRPQVVPFTSRAATQDPDKA